MISSKVNTTSEGNSWNNVDISNNPNKALFDILDKTFTNPQVLDNFKIHPNHESPISNLALNSNSYMVVDREDAPSLLRMVQLCFSSMAVTFTSSSSTFSTSSSKSHQKGYSSRKSSIQYASNLSAHEFVMLKQSPHLESLQKMRAPIIMNPQDHFNMKILIGDSAPNGSVTSTTNSVTKEKVINNSHGSSSSKANDFGSKENIMTDEMQKSLLQRPFVPFQIVYELWKEILQLTNMKFILKRMLESQISTKIGEDEDRDGDENSEKHIDDPSITVDTNTEIISNKDSAATDMKQAADDFENDLTKMESELSNEECIILAKLFFSKQIQKPGVDTIDDESDDATVTTHHLKKHCEDNIDDDYNEQDLQETMNKCCDYIRDVLVHLGVLDVITITTDAEQQRLNATVTGGSVCSNKNSIELTSSLEKNDDEADKENDNVTIATGLSDWAGADDFSLFSTSLLSNTRSMRAATFGRIKEEVEEVKVIFDTETQDHDPNNLDSCKKISSSELQKDEKDVCHVFFRINHDITQDYGVHLSKTKFLTPPHSHQSTYREVNTINGKDEAQRDDDVSSNTSPRSPSLRWNRSLVRALLLRGNMPLLDQSQPLDNNSDVNDVKTIFSTFTKFVNRQAPMDIQIMYAVRMLPRHMIKASLLSDAAKCIRDRKFVQTRLLSMGSLEGVIRQRRDCHDIKKSICQSAESKHIFEEDDIPNSDLGLDNKEATYNYSDNYHALRWARRVTIKSYELLSHFILHSANKILTNQSKISPEKKDKKISSLAHELGQALHTMGICFGEQDMMRLEMTHYENALRLKKTVLGENDISVAETLHCMGAVHQSRNDSYRAMRCYHDALDIFRPLLGEDSLNVANILHNIGVVYCGTREYDAALTIFEESLRVRRLKLGDNHEDISDTIQWIGKAHRELGDYDAALKHFKAAHYGKEARFGSEHLAVAECLNNLGIIHDDIGNQEESLSCYKESLQVKKRILGRDHPDIVESLQNIASLYRDMKKNGKSLACYLECIKVLEIKMRVDISSFVSQNKFTNLIECYHEAILLTKMKVGDDHGDLAMKFFDLGNVYDKLNQYENSIEAYEQALKIWRVLIDHVNISLVLNSLGVAHAKRSIYEKAMLCFDEALYIRKNRLGEDSLLVATVHHNMGNTHAKQKEYEKAMKCYDAALKIRKREYGDTHVTVARTLHNMGRICDEMCQYETAKNCYEVALKIREIKLGKNNLEVAFTLNSIGHVHLHLCQFDNAMKSFERSLKIRKTKFKDDHELVADSIYSIAKVHQAKGDEDEAYRMFEESLWMYKKFLDEDHIFVAQVYESLGDISMKRCDLVKTISNYQKSLSIKAKIVDAENKDLIASMYKLGSAHAKNGDYTEALSCFKDVLKVRKKKLGKDHVSVAEVLNDVGITQCKRGQHEIAKRCLEEALRIRKLLLGESSELVADTLCAIGTVHEEMEDYNEAKCLYTEALQMYKAECGPKHIKVADALNLLGGLYKIKQKYSNAMKIFDEVLRIRTMQDGIDDLALVSTYRQMGKIQMINNDYINAKISFDESLRLQKLHLHEDHQDFAEGMNDLGLLFLETENFEDAMECFKEVLRVNKKFYGEVHIKVASVQLSIGKILEDMGEFDDALSFYDQVLYSRKMNLSDDHLDIAEAYQLVGSVHAKKGKDDEALRYFEGALQIIRSKDESEKHSVESSKILYKMGCVYNEKGEPHEGMKYFKESLRLKKDILGKDHIDLIEPLEKIVEIYLSHYTDGNEKAMKHCKDILRLQVKHLGSGHLNSSATLFTMGVLFSAMEKFDEALKCFDGARSIKKKKYGSQSMEVAEILDKMGECHMSMKDYTKAIQRWEIVLSVYRDGGIEENDPVIVDTLDNIKIARDLLAKYEEF